MKASANLFLAALVGLIAASPAWADLTNHKINARGQGQITSETTAGGTTKSRIIGGGLLQGTTTSELIFTGFDPRTGDVFYEGTLVLTTRHGTLTLSIFNGVLAPTGEFSNDSAVTGGTGRFAEATGSLFFHGFVAADGTFTDDAIRGTISVDLP